MEFNFSVTYAKTNALLSMVSDIMIRLPYFCPPQGTLSEILLLHKDTIAKETGLVYNYTNMGIYHFKVANEQKLVFTKLKYGI